ncbi:MAG: endo-1,4-beta-xylanase [Defluviitaleaceae bacterium]|nr:endo-1,4-beta-xylanase [Defluviitaleaceae bacterium]
MQDRFAARKGKVVVNISGAAGKAVAVEQVKHKFLFGCSEFSTLPFVAGEMDDAVAAAAAKRFDHMAELMNFVTLPFYWGRYEPEHGKPDFKRMMDAAKYLKGRGMTLKGHPLCWHTVCCDWLLDMPNDKILEVQLDRIERDIKAFEGVVDMWDVINEAVIMPLFNKYDNAMTRVCNEYGRIKLIKKLFARARDAGKNATLLINDFEMSEAYDILVEGLLEAGVQIDAIGLQSHMHQGLWSEEKLDGILRRFERFGLPLHFTEISLVSGEIMPRHIVDLNDHQVDSWPSTPEGEARQAQQAVWLYEKLFEHPLMVGITWWSYMDGLWLKAPSGLLDKNSDPKPAYNALHKKIKGEWWTSKHEVIADASGNITVEGFHGDYVAVFEGKEFKFEV